MVDNKYEHTTIRTYPLKAVLLNSPRNSHTNIKNIPQNFIVLSITSYYSKWDQYCGKQMACWDYFLLKSEKN